MPKAEGPVLRVDRARAERRSRLNAHEDLAFDCLKALLSLIYLLSLLSFVIHTKQLLYSHFTFRVEVPTTTWADRTSWRRRLWMLGRTATRNA